MSRRRTIIIWILYGFCAALFLLLQSWLLNRIVIWDVHPFIIPFLGVLPATVEGRRNALIYAFFLGLFCDIVMPVFLPCFYCIVLPLLALFANFTTRRLIRSRFICGVLTCGGALLCVDLLHTLYILYQGYGTLWDALLLSGKEIAASLLVLPFVLLAYGNLRRFISNS